jgi:predicted metalloprotease with PDZ domain
VPLDQHVRYALSCGVPNEHLYSVSIEFVAPADQPRLILPSWRPGRYLIQNYAANVRSWSARALDGAPLEMRKCGKSEWLVAAAAGTRVQVSYRFYAGVLDAGSSFLDEDEAYFNGSNLFMWIDGLRDVPCELALEVPRHWRIETQLPRLDATPIPTFRARDYDHLIDSPTVAAAELTTRSFDESGASIHLVIRGAEPRDLDPYLEAYLEPMRAMVRSQAELFGGLPFAEYRFLYHVGDRWHGVEHEDSCSIILKRQQFLGARPGDEGFDHFLSISSHELFHAWNVKRILPQRFLPYDYTVETPTRLLWVMEGITSYYGDLMLARSGSWSAQRYLQHLASEIELLENSPGRALLSLSQASFDGWLQDPAQMHDKSNAWFSFYNKGEIVAALLDLTIRQRTDGARSLDDVMLALWKEYGATVDAVIHGNAGSPRGLEEDALERVTERVTGLELRDFFARFVDGTEPLPYAELFEPAGVAFSSERKRESSAAFGAKLRSGDGGMLVESVIAGGAAMLAGVLPGDELIALNGARIHGDAQLRAVLRALRSDAEVELLSARDGVVRRRMIALQGDRSVAITLDIRQNATAEQVRIRSEWLKTSK